jgi:hypothetical protein
MPPQVNIKWGEVRRPQEATPQANGNQSNDLEPADLKIHLIPMYGDLSQNASKVQKENLRSLYWCG